METNLLNLKRALEAGSCEAQEVRYNLNTSRAFFVFKGN